MQRWRLEFSCDGREYLRQLRSLGAIVGIETQIDPRTIVIFRKLFIPAEGDLENWNAIKRVWWIEVRAEVVQALVRALEIDLQPQRLVVFLPPEVEQKLLRVELHHAQSNDEHQIEETVFQFVKVGHDRFEPVVISQR
jgi:hypothetical protein